MSESKPEPTIVNAPIMPRWVHYAIWSGVITLFTTAVVIGLATAKRPSSSDGWGVQPPEPVMPRLSDKQKDALNTAVRGFSKLEAATKTGVVANKYSELRIDAQTAVSEAVRRLPKGSTTDHLQELMQTHTDAGRVWEHMIQFPELKLKAAFGFAESMKRHNIREGENSQVALQLIWQHARQQLSELEKVSDKLLAD